MKTVIIYEIFYFFKGICFWKPLNPISTSVGKEGGGGKTTPPPTQTLWKISV